MIQGAIKNLNYDTTIEGIITDVSQKKDGIYYVKADDGGVIKAYAPSTDSYYKNDTVFVLVPKGDMSRQKLITGRKVNEEVANQTFTMKLPFDDFIGLEHLDADPGFKGEYSFIANKDADRWKDPTDDSENEEANKRVLLWEWNKFGIGKTDPEIPGRTLDPTNPDDIPKFLKYYSDPAIENKMGIECNVESLLGDYRPSAGVYGLRIEVTGMTKPEENKSAAIDTSVCLFLNDDMYGNSYAFYTPYSQQKIFDISAFSSLYRIAIYFVQDCNFLDEVGKPIPAMVDTIPGVADEGLPNSEETVPGNLNISAIKVYLGLTSEEIGTDKVFLYTYDDIFYGHSPKDLGTVRAEADRRQLRAAWVHKESDGSFTLYNNIGGDIDLETGEGQFGLIGETDAKFYWYHYDNSPQVTEDAGADEEVEEKPDTDTDTKVEEKLTDDQITASKLGGLNWKYLKDLNPTELDAQDVSHILSKSVTNVVLNAAKGKEKYKLIVYHDHTYTASDVLTFSNVVDIDAVQEALVANDGIIFKLFRKIPIWYDTNNEERLSPFDIGIQNGVQVTVDHSNDGEGGWRKAYKLQEDPNLNNFFVYDENNHCIKDTNNLLWSDSEYYIQIYIDTTPEAETHDYKPFISEEDLGTENYKITWNTPTVNSMLKSIAPVAVDPDHGIESEIAATAPGAPVNKIEAITQKFRIAEDYDVIATNNEISATIQYNKRTYNLTKRFQFGQSSSMGSPYTIVISSESTSYALVQNSAFNLVCRIFDQQGREIEDVDRSSATFKWTLLGPAVITPDLQDIIGPTTSPKWATTDVDGYQGNKITGSVRSLEPPIFKVTVTGLPDYPISAVKGFMVTGNAPENVAFLRKYIVRCPDRIEFKADGTLPIYDTNYFQVADQQSNELIYPIWTRHLKVRQNNSYVENAKYIALEEKVTAKKTFSTNQVALDIPEHTEYKISPTQPDGTTGWYWQDDMDITYYLYLSCKYGDIVVNQAVPFSRNVYSSSLLNSWDGTLNIDKENNAISSKMISAGTKDSSNTFSGVMMGDWADNGDAALDIPGLYGVQRGVQTFGFKTDGSAFLGKSGQGQIVFNGNQALISDKDKDCYVNLNPLRYTNLPDGTASVSENAESYSPYFLYAKSPKNSDIIGQYTDIKDATMWAKDFMEDDANDYFVVDPNNGVLTTGGIIAKYGSIGNWMISGNGMYQKYFNADSGLSRYMYLGFPSDEIEALLRNERASHEGELQRIKENYVLKLNKITSKYYPAIYALDPIHYWNQGRPVYVAEQILLHAKDILDTYIKNTPGSSINTLTEDQIDQAIRDAADIIDLDAEFNRFYHAHYYIPEGTPDYSTYDYKGYTLGVYLTGLRGTIFTILGYSYNSTKRQIKAWHLNRNGSIDTQHGSTGFSLLVFDGQIYRLTTDEVKNKPTINFSLAGTAEGTGSKTVVLQCLNTLTYNRIVEVIEGNRPSYQDHLASYLAQVQKQIDLGKANIPFAERKALEDEYNAAVIEENKRYAAAVKEYMDREDPNRYAIWAGEQEHENPVFYVRWDGRMYARSGQLGETSPWYIDDTGLTQTKNSGIIFLGDPDRGTKTGEEFEYVNDAGTSQKFLKGAKSEYGIAENDGHFAIWMAGQLESSGQSDKTTLNFGVTPKGYLFSRSGRIGGWSVSNNTLSSVTSGANGKPKGIIFNSTLKGIYAGQSWAQDPNNPDQLTFPIMIDGENGILSIQSNNSSDSAVIGTITLSDFSIQASSQSTITLPSITIDSSDLILGGDTVSGSGDDSWGVSSGSLTIGTTTSQQATVADTESRVSNAGSCDIARRYDTGFIGLKITASNTIETQNSAGEWVPSTKPTLTLLPTSSGIGGSFWPSLGDSAHRWDLYAETINCNRLDTQAAIVSPSIYMTETIVAATDTAAAKTRNHLVATQFWVNNQLVDIWNRIAEVGGSGGGGGRIGGLGSALRASVPVDWVYDFTRDTTYDAQMVNVDGNPVGKPVTMVSPTHAHDLVIEGTTLTMPKNTPLDPKKPSLLHSHPITFGFSDGQITLTLGVVTGFSEDAAATSASFNVASSSWYLSTAGATLSAPPNEQTYLAAYKNIQVPYYIIAKDGKTTVKSDHLLINASDAYDAGHTAGYTAGQNSVPAPDIGTPYIYTGTGTKAGQYQARITVDGTTKYGSWVTIS